MGEWRGRLKRSTPLPAWPSYDRSQQVAAAEAAEAEADAEAEAEAAVGVALRVSLCSLVQSDWKSKAVRWRGGGDGKNCQQGEGIQKMTKKNRDRESNEVEEESDYKNGGRKGAGKFRE